MLILLYIGGWDPKTGEMKADIQEEMEQALDNVELALKDAGGKGWSQVYKINSYHTDMSHSTLMHMVEGIKKRMPDHKPILTCVGVTQLGIEGMRVEIEVAAYDPEGAIKGAKWGVLGALVAAYISSNQRKQSRVYFFQPLSYRVKASII